MTPEQALQSYRRMINSVGEDVTIRRYTGTGSSRTHADTTIKGFARDYSSRELIGEILQGDWTAIVLVDGLSAILPVLVSDKILTTGRTEAAIKNISQRKVAGTLIALEIQAAG